MTSRSLLATRSRFCHRSQVARVHVGIRIQEEDFSLDSLYASCRERVGGAAGAIASFVGLVREQANDDSVVALELEHYPGMTEKSIEKITKQAQDRWRLLDIEIVHRIGKLAAGDQIVFVQVASGHRPDAFAACEFLMDYLKTEAIFWKREVRTTETVWIESTQDDKKRAQTWKEDQNREINGQNSGA